MISLDVLTPPDVMSALAMRVKTRRLELNLTQEGLATRAGLPFSTYRRFEQKGEISLRGLLGIAFALDCLDDFSELFSKKQYATLDEAINGGEVTRKRGKKND